jgi:quercetin dioxygenase-like cupin family protein
VTEDINAGVSVTQRHHHERYLRFEDSVVRVLLDARVTGGRLSMVENHTTRPFASPVHLHDREDEAFIVLDGSIRAWVGDDHHDVGSGGVAFLPHGIPHAFRVTSPEARFLVLSLPGGLEQLYQGAGWNLRTPPPDDWAVSIAQLAASEAQRGNRILGPPPEYNEP